MRRGQASPAGARKGGALTRAIARQNGKRPEAARARDSPASDTVSFGGRSSPGEKPGAQRPSSAPSRRSFEPPSRASPAGSVGAQSVQRQSSDSGLLKAKSVLVVEEASGSPNKLRDKARAVGMMKRAQTAVLASPEEPTDVDLLLKKTNFAPDVESDQRKRALSVPSSPDNKSSQPLAADLPQGPPRRNVITPTPDPTSDDGSRPTRSKHSELPQRRTALIAMATGAETADRIKSLFGAGNRVDPKVWTAWVENLAHSGQSQPMAGHFGEVDHEDKRQKEATDKEHMEFLTEDYFLQDLDQSKDPAEKTGKSKQGRPKKPMSTAFTDRGVRMREGVATKHLLRMDLQSYEDEGPTKHKAGCNCSVCQPTHIHPAGQPTHACAHNVVADPVKVKVGKHNYPQAQSPGVRKALEYAQGSAHEHELLFQQSMTRKGRVQADTSSTTAGQYRRPKTEAMVKKSPEGGNPTLQRSDASYILNPRESDPPHPHDRICNTRKARGEFKEGYSQECTRFAVKWNQDLYRFDVLSYGGDAIRPLFRAGSCPPNQSSANPITGDVKDNVKSPRRKTEHEQKGREKAGQAVPMLTNHTDLDAQAKEDRENRMQVDENFAKLCKAGVELGSTRAAEVSKIKATQFRHLSTNVANALKWDD